MAFEIIKQFYHKEKLLTHIISTWKDEESAKNELNRINQIDPFQHKYKFSMRESDQE